MAHEHHHATVDRGHDHGHGHDHDDGHSHGSSLWARGRHAVSELIGGHSHDAADQVDEVLEADADGRRALLVSLAALGVTAAIQAVVVVLSGSVALLGDTLHNVADAAAESRQAQSGSHKGLARLISRTRRGVTNRA